MGVMEPQGILEASVYVADLEAAREFYEKVLGLRCLVYEPPRHAFFRVGSGMLLVFNPDETAVSEDVPAHGAHGPVHVALAVAADELDEWAAKLEAAGVETHWASWPGGRSLFFRDPDGNLLELAPPEIWGLE